MGCCRTHGTLQNQWTPQGAWHPWEHCDSWICICTVGRAELEQSLRCLLAVQFRGYRTDDWFDGLGRNLINRRPCSQGIKLGILQEEMVTVKDKLL